jgi:hypothetical protein
VGGAPRGAAGAVFELAALVAARRADEARRGRVLVVVPLRTGMAARARELVAAGPPFDLEAAELDRHQVFVTEREAIFLFEGRDVRETVERLIRSPRVLRDLGRWRRCAAGPPRIADETYAWLAQDNESKGAGR